MKEAIKRKQREKQDNKCAITGIELPEDTGSFHTHRKIPKAQGGTYSDDNYIVVLPTAHMQEHGTLRVRNLELELLKATLDDREQTRKFYQKVCNQLHACERMHVDYLHENTINFLNEKAKECNDLLKIKDKELSVIIKRMAKNNPLVKSATEVYGIGPVTIAYCLCYIDITKANHASSLWKYAGLHTASHTRYVKGESSGGNKSLRTALYTTAVSQVKLHGPYRVVYDNTKARLEKSEKITQSRNTQGKLIECAWKDTKPSHRHGAALRIIMKHFLADYWYVARTLAGLPVSKAYPEEILGGCHKTIMPEERGWIY